MSGTDNLNKYSGSLKKLSGYIRRLVFNALLALISLLFLIIGLVILEGSFRLYLHLKKKEAPVILSAESTLKKSWFDPHPHLVYTFKPNNSFIMNTKGDPHLTTNEYGFRSTLEYEVTGKRKPAGTVRIVTFGGSTTMGVNDDDKVWPYLTGKYLQNNFPKIEVLNEGIMGYTSLDNLIDLSLRVVEFDADVFVLYIGFNDYMTIAPPDIFRNDQSHFRQSFYQNIVFSPVDLFPEWLLRSAVVRQLLWFGGVPDRRNLLENVGTRNFRNNSFNWRSLSLSKHKTIFNRIDSNILRNIRSMVAIIKAHHPHSMIILSSLYYLKETSEYGNAKVLSSLNKKLKSLSEKEEILFLDVANMIPHKKKYARDPVHFSVAGERAMANILADLIKLKYKPLTQN
jgi:lysophospholipase L1-like esterase